MRNEAEEESELALREQKIYGDMPVPKAVATMIIPTIISQIITVIYYTGNDGRKLFTETNKEVAKMEAAVTSRTGKKRQRKADGFNG